MKTPFSQMNLSSVEHVWVEYHVAESQNKSVRQILCTTIFTVFQKQIAVGEASLPADKKNIMFWTEEEWSLFN
jgi:hypothetical protein